MNVKKTLTFDPELYHMLEKESEETGRPMGDILCEALREYLKKLEPLMRWRPD